MNLVVKLLMQIFDLLLQLLDFSSEVWNLIDILLDNSGLLGNSHAFTPFKSIVKVTELVQKILELVIVFLQPSQDVLDLLVMLLEVV